MAYFITGATGFIGRNLMERLLGNRNGKIYVLVREGSTARLEDLTDRWSTATGEPVAKRIVPVVGDLRRPLLGLDEEQITELRGKIEHFVHLAAIYDMTAPAEQNERGERRRHHPRGGAGALAGGGVSAPRLVDRRRGRVQGHVQ